MMIRDWSDIYSYRGAKLFTIVVNNLSCMAYHAVWLTLNGPFTCLMRCWFALIRLSAIYKKWHIKQEDRFHCWPPMVGLAPIVYVSVSREKSFAIFKMGIVKSFILLAIFSHCGAQGQGTYCNTPIVIWYARYIARYIVWSDIEASRKMRGFKLCLDRVVVSRLRWLSGRKYSDCYIRM